MSGIAGFIVSPRVDSSRRRPCGVTCPALGGISQELSMECLRGLKCVCKNEHRTTT